MNLNYFGNRQKGRLVSESKKKKKSQYEIQLFLDD